MKMRTRSGGGKISDLCYNKLKNRLPGAVIGNVGHPRAIYGRRQKPVTCKKKLWAFVLFVRNAALPDCIISEGVRRDPAIRRNSYG